MPNRYLREGLLTSDAMDHTTPEEERMFTRLLLAVDDFGRFDGRSVIVRARCFPLKADLALATVDKWLAGLARVGLVRLYDVAGKPYIQVLRWTETPRSKKSKFPDPEVSREHLQTSREHLHASAPQGVDHVPVLGFGSDLGNEIGFGSDHEKVQAPAAVASVAPVSAPESKGPTGKGTADDLFPKADAPAKPKVPRKPAASGIGGDATAWLEGYRAATGATEATAPPSHTWITIWRGRTMPTDARCFIGVGVS